MRANEPLVTVASLTALVSAVVVALVAFGLDLTDDQQKAVFGIAAVVAPLVVTLARGKVTPVREDYSGEGVTPDDPSVGQH